MSIKGFCFKILLMVLLLLSLFLFSACADNKKDNEDEEQQMVYGDLYTLQQAYVNGFISYEDLISIAYYHNGGREHNEEIMSEDYKPSLKTPEVLSELTVLKIKSAAAKDYRENYNVKDAKAEGFTIIEYCGTYGDCVAIMMRDDYSGTTGAVWIDSVAGVNIYYNSGKEIQIWKDTK